MPSALPPEDFVAARFPFPGFAVDHLAFSFSDLGPVLFERPDLGAVLLAFLDGEAVLLAFPFPPWGALGAIP